MSLFRRENENDDPVSPQAAQPSQPPVQQPAPRRTERAPQRQSTLIAPGAKISGEVNGSSDLVVDGEVEGKVELDSDVTVGAEGRIKGNISARNVRIGGRVRGNVRGLDKVEILATGRLEGDVVSPRMVLAEGAFFKGKVEMTGTKGEGR